ncbi:MAG: NFACT family protein [Clostridia bacterium]|nr:NFACT family protein [Clostridia bacterium]
MAFDGITLHSIVDELQVLINGKVNQIYQPDKNNITISVYSKKTYMLNIDTTANNYRIHISTHPKSNPYKAPNFCMLLRKYLAGAKVSNIYVKGLERICYIDFECLNEMNDRVKRTLIIELMGKYSNVILVNENNTIIDALKKFDSESDLTCDVTTSRSIMPARIYKVPSDKKSEITLLSLEQFESIINSSEYKTLDNAIPNLFTGISKMFIQSSLEKLHLSNTVGHNSVNDIFNYINYLLTNSSKIYFGSFKNNYSIFYDSNYSKDSFEINNQLDDFYYDKTENEFFVMYRNNLLKVLSGTLDKLTNKLNNINTKIDSCSNMDKFKLYGELLIANIYRFNHVYTDFVEVENYYDNNELIKINIDNSLTISQNAEKYFKKYNKMKNTLRISEIQKKETQIELDYLGLLVSQLDSCNTIDDVDAIYSSISQNILFNDIKFKKKNKVKKIRKDDNTLNNYMKLKIDDFDVFIGKNNKQNDYLTTKVANDNDYWFHTKDIHGSHLILRCNGEMPKLTTIKKCAKLSAYYSKAKFSSHVPVDYTLVKHVKKPNGSVPGYVIYTNNKTVYVDPENLFVKNV